MKRRDFLKNVVASVGVLPAAPSADLRKLASLDGDSADLHVWTDTCNVYVIREGESAVLIDLGDGSVLERLGDIGVRRVEWVLFTHHHREQNQGYPRLQPWGAKVAAPEAERVLFERPSEFRKIWPTLSDRFTVHGASYVRPPIQPIHLDRGFARMDDFTWRGHEFRCVETKGDSPGAMSYFLKHAGRWLAFSGDVMFDGARMHTWFDTEWDYGFAKGLYSLHEAASLVGSYDPSLVLPSHGAVMFEARRQFEVYQEKLKRLTSLVLRGYNVSTFGAAEQDNASKPTAVPHVWQVSPHLFKFKGPDYWPNMHLLLADSGHALAIDCGLFDNAFLDRALERMRERLGLKQIDACIITHMHGDHMLNANHLREKWGARVWALENMVEKCEHPERFDYAALVEAYGKDLDSVSIDRALKAGETLDWEGYRLRIDWMPGQTEFALCVSGRIDGKLVAFTGDNLFGNGADPNQDGHEAVVARNSAILEEGYIYGAEFLSRLKPDLILGGHSWVIDSPGPMIERYRKWAYNMRAAFQSLSADEDYRYWFDPYWVRVEPYRAGLRRGESTAATVHLRNFRPRSQKHRIEVHASEGLTVTPAVLEGQLESGARASVPVRVTAAAGARPGTHIVALDVSLDGRRYGEWFDFVAGVEA
jgi:glyoxylase-like metal-dependent hydrolase (beta-lactamase superfamily II)